MGAAVGSGEVFARVFVGSLPTRGGCAIGQSLGRSCPDFPVLRLALIRIGAARSRAVGSGLLAGRGLRVVGGVCGCVSSGRYGVTACPGGPFHALAGWASVRAAMAGWRRSLARQRLLLGPMLPAGMPSRALISV